MFGSPSFGNNPFEMQPREDPGEVELSTESFITLQTFGSRGCHPGTMNSVRTVSVEYGWTLQAIRSLPQTNYEQPNC